MTDLDLAAYLEGRRALVESALEERLPPAAQEPRSIHAALRHATLDGGKRLRPILALETAVLAGHAPGRILDVACALEFVHTASLILDDLPSMDNAVSRRSRPCTHAVFGEATAILAALGLIGLAFDLLARNAQTLDRPDAAADAVRRLAQAIGPSGIIHGQHADLGLVEAPATLETLERTYGQKAGALFVVAVDIPGHLLDMPEDEVDALRSFALDLGLAFQIIDDLLDAHQKPEDRGKVTFATYLGTEGARARAAEFLDRARAALDIFGERAETLRKLSDHVGTRVD